jgi:hypothetical protein
VFSTHLENYWAEPVLRAVRNGVEGNDKRQHGRTSAEVQNLFDRKSVDSDWVVHESRPGLPGFQFGDRDARKLSFVASRSSVTAGIMLRCLLVGHTKKAGCHFLKYVWASAQTKSATREVSLSR